MSNNVSLQHTTLEIFCVTY